jgi:two-component system, LytTR family, sensor histidine kinase AlgZ
VLFIIKVAFAGKQACMPAPFTRLNSRLKTPTPTPPPSREDSEFAATQSRPASVWPQSTRDPLAAGARFHSTFAHSRFDPVAEERARLQAQAAAAFDVCHPALALRAVLLVQAALAVVALAGAQSLVQWGTRQAALCFGGLMATLLWLVLVCAWRQPLRQLGSASRAAVVLGLGACTAALAWLPLAWAGMVHTSPFGAAAAVLAGLAFAAALWAWLDVRSRIWHPAQTSARLAELQSRIRPHFLFNALNTALALVRVDPQSAENVLEDLAQLFRVALADAGASVSLEEEIELARRYLAIESVRFGQRLQVVWDIDERVFPARVPPLVLQPLVENAVRHGIEPATQGGQVLVQAQLQRGQVTLLVSNTVPLEPSQPGHGMALHNVRERLRLLHDVGAQCDVWQADGQFHARITLPAP